MARSANRSPPSGSAATISAAASMTSTAARAVVHRALDLGVTLFDTADVYGNGTSEEFLGETLGARRKDVVLATKFGWPCKHPDRRRVAALHHAQAAEASLKRLRTDWIDLYQVHFPDPKTPIEETLRALDELVRQGKVRAIGCSNFSAEQVDEAQDTAATRTSSRRSSPARTNTACWCAASSSELIPVDAKARPERFCPISRSPAACSPANTSAASRCRRTRGSPTAATTPRDVINDRNWSLVEKLEAVAARSGHSHAGAGVRLAARQADGGERDRRRHQARADRAERRGRRAPRPRADDARRTRPHHRHDQSARSSSAARSAGCSPPTCCAASAGTRRCSSATRRAGRPRRRHQPRIRSCTRSRGGSASRSTIRWASASTSVVFHRPRRPASTTSATPCA